MRIINRWILIGLIMCLLLGCTPDQRVELPTPEKVSRIKWSQWSQTKTGKQGSIDNPATIREVIQELQSKAKFTRDQSLNDGPTNVERYLRLEFSQSTIPDTPSVLYIYARGSKYYLEQPYTGIWRIPETSWNSIWEQVEASGL